MRRKRKWRKVEDEREGESLREKKNKMEEAGRERKLVTIKEMKGFDVFSKKGKVERTL